MLLVLGVLKLCSGPPAGSFQQPAATPPDVHNFSLDVEALSVTEGASSKPDPAGDSHTEDTKGGEEETQEEDDSHGGGAQLDTDNFVHVCFCTDEPDLRPLTAAINSTLVFMSSPTRLFVHVVTSSEKAEHFRSSLGKALPGVRLEVHYDVLLEHAIRERITYRKSSAARESLTSAFNFAPFYLDHFLSPRKPGNTMLSRLPERLIYLDSDVIVTGDVEELVKIDLQEHAVAAVEDCSQRLQIYMNFKELNHSGWLEPRISPEACVFNRGVFLVDLAKWKELRHTEEIETWMSRYSSSKKDLYKFGLSQPPWLLTLVGRYVDLGEAWNCRGLGRDRMLTKEQQELKSAGYGKQELKQLHFRPWGAEIQPFISLKAEKAKVLHFNGPIKPWKPKTLDKAANLPPLCALPQSITWEIPIFAEAAGRKFVRCANIWSSFLSTSVNEELEASSTTLGP